MKKQFSGSFSYKKDIGKVRDSNEDDTKVVVNSKSDVLMVVADGMGGCLKGEFASSKIVEYLTTSFLESPTFLTTLSIKNWISKKLKKVNTLIYNKSFKEPEFHGMGSTAIVAILHHNKLVIANIGDSRAYILNKKEFVQISEDQTYVNYLFNSGLIKEEEKSTHPDRHVLTNAIGIYPSVSIEFHTLQYDKESIFLCSDGLYNNLKNNDIENILRTDDDSETKVKNLINLANYNGGSDNISVALRECLDD